MEAEVTASWNSPKKFSVYRQKHFPEESCLNQFMWRLEFVWNLLVSAIQKTNVQMLEKIKFRGVNYCTTKEDSEEDQACTQLVKYCGRGKPRCKGHRAQMRDDCAAYHLTNISFGANWMDRIDELEATMLEIAETAFDELAKRLAFRIKYSLDYHDMGHRQWEEKLRVISDKHWRSNPNTGEKEMKLAMHTWEEHDDEINEFYRNEDELLLEAQRELEQIEGEHFLAANEEEQVDWDDGNAFPHHHHYVHDDDQEDNWIGVMEDDWV